MVKGTTNLEESANVHHWKDTMFMQRIFAYSTSPERGKQSSEGEETPFINPKKLLRVKYSIEEQ